MSCTWAPCAVIDQNAFCRFGEYLNTACVLLQTNPNVSRLLTVPLQYVERNASSASSRAAMHDTETTLSLTPAQVKLINP